MSMISLPDYPGMQIRIIRGSDTPIQLVVASTARGAPCPTCNQWSERIHSQYSRQLQELPAGRFPLQITLWTHRFFCDTPTCSQQIFCERVRWAPRYQRRTSACTERLLTLAWEMSAEATRRTARAEGISVSRPTINRLLVFTAAHAAGSSGKPDTATVIGVDDWAWKKGQRYGTLIVDLQTHRPIAVLADRTAETLADWLRLHPQIAIISRDRGGAYARGAREGAPQAQQVADRFHLLKNWGDHVAALIGTWASSSLEGAQDPVPAAPRATTKPTAVSRAKQERWTAAHRLQATGASLSAIAGHLHCARATVRQDLLADQPRVPKRRRRRAAAQRDDQLLRELWQGDRTMTAQALWEAARACGYVQSVGTVSRWLSQRRGPVPRGRRSTAVRSAPGKDACRPRMHWTARQWAHILGTAWQHLPRRTTNPVSARLAADPVYRQAWTLTRHFQTLMTHRCGHDALAAWCRAAEASGVPDFRKFAQTLREDWDAVVAGVTLEWSQGPVEGLNNRTKMLKRMMYGRAGLPLLSARILHH